ncbi:MAG: tRNA guanosine(34) transglycosylase Tgt [bacterium]|nr:tRNA guanosine(34) transglycosylase Tgt [bacterium]
MLSFQIDSISSDSKARKGVLKTSHGEFETPVFMPVGTQGSVKTLTPEELEKTGSEIILHNTYHLYLRPGADLFMNLGGAHNFSKWNGPILTDSGGYQVFSLADLNKITDDGVRFQSHIDGSYHFFTPESVIDIQKKIGADIIMPLDRPVPYPSEKIVAQKANRVTLNWLRISRDTFADSRNYHDYDQTLFGIVQGGIYRDLRKYAVEETVNIGFPGYSVGGLSVGEPQEIMYEMTDYTTDFLPKDKPRYLMGVGKPEDLVNCIGSGIDMFDCVLPTRVGRNGWVYTDEGRLVIKNAEFINDNSPIDEKCSCYACRTFSRSYIRHLFNAGEMLGPRMASLHNISYYQRLMKAARDAIIEDRYSKWKNEFLEKYKDSDKSGIADN